MYRSETNYYSLILLTSNANMLHKPVTSETRELLIGLLHLHQFQIILNKEVLYKVLK